ncbi:exodeoxyribonuclease VII large subunit [Anaerospora sp.]|jgi:exodeoxyribonuclease VII large subunit|uniref:exodeoxyribonuclease VII large subunit n=1 Tax=Anaerospora sp. TaxID=1960278 RepID=UPI00289D21FB|nr:exodeoxyribonuclease VII large subunit [Anaerospora sp.]MDF2927843.1 Exodeoxyribonuclease 7 large subunit [Anaerospora sp.]
MQIFSIGDVTRYIKHILDKDRTLNSIYVRGEISNFKRHYSGHCYFTLKDSDATIKTVMFRSRSQLLKFEPRDGMKVVVGGTVTVFERDGQYQLYADHMVPEGVGELSLAYEQLKEKLTAEGLFAQTRKKSLPVLPRAVGIITSPTGAAVRDIITVAKRRHPSIALVLFPVQVQGGEAPGQIVDALQVFNEYNQVDVIIVGRGGGSLEELWAFNDEKVVRAIAASKIPVVSAVGHETDFTLADFVADLRAATPSQAAEIVVPDIYELSRYVRTLENLMGTHIQAIVKEKRRSVLELRQSTALQRPMDLLAAKQQQVDLLQQRLIQITELQLTAKKHAFSIQAEKLAMLNPLSVLARGYSITRTKEGQVVSDASQVEPDQEIEILLSQGILSARVCAAKEA